MFAWLWRWIGWDGGASADVPDEGVIVRGGAPARIVSGGPPSPVIGGGVPARIVGRGNP